MIKKIDVIIPVFNASNTVVQCLNSVLKQTLKPEQIIIVDDGSTDDSIKKCKELLLNQNKVKYTILSQFNQGAGPARNLGLIHATSEYIAFIDSDDEWYENKLEKQVQLFSNSEFKNLGMVYCGYENINLESKIIDEPIVYPRVRGEIARELIFGNYISGCCSAILFKKHCVDICGKFIEEKNPTEDWDFCFKIALQFEVDYVPETLVKIRRHPGNTTKVVTESKYIETRIELQLRYVKLLNMQKEVLFDIKKNLLNLRLNSKNTIKIFLKITKIMPNYLYELPKLIFRIFLFKIIWKLYCFKYLNKNSYENFKKKIINSFSYSQ